MNTRRAALSVTILIVFSILWMINSCGGGGGGPTPSDPGTGEGDTINIAGSWAATETCTKVVCGGCPEVGESDDLTYEFEQEGDTITCGPPEGATGSVTGTIKGNKLVLSGTFDFGNNTTMTINEDLTISEDGKTITGKLIQTVNRCDVDMCTGEFDVVLKRQEGNSKFWGTYDMSIKVGECPTDTLVVTIGNDWGKRNDEQYVLLPLNVSSFTYYFNDEGDPLMRTVTVSGAELTVETTYDFGDPGDYVGHFVFTFANDYENITVSGFSSHNIADEDRPCEDTYSLLTGNGTRK